MSDATINPQEYSLQSNNNKNNSNFLAYPGLKSISTGDLEIRLAAVKHFNALVSDALPLIDLGMSLSPGTLSHSVANACSLIWLKSKMDIWNKALTATAGAEGGIEFSLNRHIAADL
jgi:hypothetical protein